MKTLRFMVIHRRTTASFLQLLLLLSNLLVVLGGDDDVDGLSKLSELVCSSSRSLLEGVRKPSRWDFWQTVKFPLWSL